MGNFPSLTPKELIKILERKGTKDLAKGTLHAILKQAGIEKEEL